jgi:hypothetical protein
VGFLLFIALTVRALRKTIGLALVVFGALISLTFIGVLIGLPMVLIGGFLLFVGKK